MRTFDKLQKITVLAISQAFPEQEDALKYARHVFGLIGNDKTLALEAVQLFSELLEEAQSNAAETSVSVLPDLNAESTN